MIHKKLHLLYALFFLLSSIFIAVTMQQHQHKNIFSINSLEWLQNYYKERNNSIKNNRQNKGATKSITKQASIPPNPVDKETK